MCVITGVPPYVHCGRSESHTWLAIHAVCEVQGQAKDTGGHKAYNTTRHNKMTAHGSNQRLVCSKNIETTGDRDRKVALV